MPYLLAGAVLVTGCSAVALAAVFSVAGRSEALVLARPVVAGQVLTPADLRSVHLGSDPGVDLLPGDGSAPVAGQRVAYSLPAGTVLTRSALGAARTPPPGWSLAAIAATPGQFPPALAAGSSVSIVQISSSPTGLPITGHYGTGNGDASNGGGGAWSGVVTHVAARGSDQTTVITILLREGAARQVAAVPAGELALILEGRADGFR